jgi:hypothetical protein
MKQYATVAVLVVMFAMVAGCTKRSANPEDSKPEPSRLFKPAMSYWNFEQAKRTMNFSQWTVEEDRRPLVSDRRPPFRILTIRVPHYRDHGYEGELVLSFYNDRLWKTQYYVPNIRSYLDVAGSDQQAMVGSEGAGAIPPHTRVWVGKDRDGKTYLGMQDEVLKQQMDDWIVRYSLK